MCILHIPNIHRTLGNAVVSARGLLHGLLRRLRRRLRERPQGAAARDLAALLEARAEGGVAFMVDKTTYGLKCRCGNQNICICTYAYIYTHRCMYVYTYTHVCTSACTIHTSTSVCVYVYRDRERERERERNLASGVSLKWSPWCGLLGRTVMY